MQQPSLDEKLRLAGAMFGSRAATGGSSSSPSGGSYLAGEGITIADRVISAEVTQKELDAVKADEIPVSWIEAL